VTPAEQRVYAAFPRLTAELVAAVSKLGLFPLAEMAAVADRLTFTGALVGAHQGVPVDPVKAARLRELIEATMEFTQKAVAISQDVEAG